MSQNYHQLNVANPSPIQDRPIQDHSIQEVELDEARALIANHLPVLDVREPVEVGQGMLEGAIHIPLGALAERAQRELPDKFVPVVIYCAAGVRSYAAAEILAGLGYADPISMAPGFNGWKAAGLPWVTPGPASPALSARYSRHLLLPEVGKEGQEKLLKSRVLVVGAGGLGSPALLYLAAAGVGHIGIIDDDVVDESNLQRQVIHGTGDIGVPKVASAMQAIAELNPDVTVEPIEARLSKENVLAVLADYDVILDGADNFATRYLINDACVLLGKPNVHGGVDRFRGQATVFSLPKGPCYRCLFDEPPPPGTALNCAEAGVLGVVPGIIGVIQATEALELILGIGEPLIGRLLSFDALPMTFREIPIRKDPDCPMCGPDGPTTLDEIEYSEFSCAIPIAASTAG
jgi:molybdopterin/thiamine biosynthesis adenylyltransferase/rhodanese-related sulfurtransferase